MDPLAVDLAEIVGSSNVLLDPHLKSSYEKDWTGQFSGRSRFVVRPATSEEVADVVRLCHNSGVAVVPQGGNTGLVGGGVPREEEVVVSLRRLRELRPVDELSGHVTVGAGVTLSELHRHAETSNFSFCVDLAARDTATIGGMIATNAGGTQVIRYGTMKAQVVGLEAVLPEGTIVERLEITKDTAGYDWPSLIVGSEGTLAIVTFATLRLHPRLPMRTTVLVGVVSTETALTLTAQVRRLVPSLQAAEIFWQEGLELVCSHFKLKPPFAKSAACYVLLEFADVRDPTEEAWDVIKDVPGIVDTAVAQDESRRRELWLFREGHTEALAALGAPLKLDVSLPLTRFEPFESELRSLVKRLASGSTLILFGHVGEGNLHVNILCASALHGQMIEAVLDLVSVHKGSISAEHGVGILKAEWIGLTRSSQEMALLRSIKRAVDPRDLLNPGVIFSKGPVQLRSG